LIKLAIETIFMSQSGYSLYPHWTINLTF